MSLWAKAQMLPAEGVAKIRAIYAEHFPLEVRHCLANWIERRVLADEQEEQQRYFVDELVQEIQSNAELLSPEMFISKVKLLEAANTFHNQYSHAQGDLYKVLQRLLGMEMEVINSYINMYPQHNVTERKYGELLGGLQLIKVSANLVNEEIRGLQANMEAFSLHYHECMKHKGHLAYLEQLGNPTDRRDIEARLRREVEKEETTLNNLVIQIKQSQLVLVDRLKENIGNLRDLQSQVLDVELIKWKREQQLSGNGVPMQSNLNSIQESCEMLAELIWLTRQQINNVIRINTKITPDLKEQHLMDMFEEMAKSVTALLSTLVTSTFVIEKQPPQVMKTNTRFTATVRLLVGGQLNVHMNPPRVTVVIISEQQAQMLLKSDSTQGRSKQPVECGDILNNSGVMEYQPNSKQLSVSFRNMQLRKIKRAEKKGTESVMDEKLTLLFQSDFNVGGGELVFQVWTLSLPVVVIVHGNQEPHGWATVTWDNAFSPPGRIPFAVPDKVNWGQLADTLRLKFSSATGGDLTEDNVKFLAEKIFRASLSMSGMELSALTVSWTQFCKDALQDRNFTFWEWFYMVVKVTRDYLRALWCDRLIMGFIQKKGAEDLLSKCPPGTFLLRFSDSELGGITIAWVGEGNEVFSLQPFTARDLVLRSLADRVYDLAHLQYLYPNIPKDEVFGKYYTKHENEVLKNGYVKPVLITTLPPYMHHASPGYAHSPDPQRNANSYLNSVTPALTESTMMDNDLYEQMWAFSPELENMDFTSGGGNM